MSNRLAKLFFRNDRKVERIVQYSAGPVLAFRAMATGTVSGEQSSKIRGVCFFCFFGIGRRLSWCIAPNSPYD
jgi:hypothetical protein